MDVRRPQTLPQAANTLPRGLANEPKKGLSKLWKTVLASLLVLLLLGVALYYFLGIGSPIDRTKYQAVFLNNGQIYFGKLSGWGTSKPVLTDVYYFQPGEAASQNKNSNDLPAENTQTLIKRGGEIHKPTDKLILNRDSILFVENIEDDGKIVDAIKQG